MNKIIGIVGGVGPRASVELVKHIFEQTKASKDREHLSIAFLSYPSFIEDRTDFILGRSNNNPADSIFSIILELEKLGAKVIGVPCNTFHSPICFDVLIEKLNQYGKNLKVVPMIKEVCEFIKKFYPEKKRIGLLATLGTYSSKVYQNIFDNKGYNIVVPPKKIQLNIHESIYHSLYGIKVHSNPVSNSAKTILKESIKYLIDMECELIILGCTELELAFKEKIQSAFYISPTLVLARALIKEIDPNKLKPYYVCKE